MMRLLKIEFAKVKNYNTFWAIIGIYILIVPLAFIGIGQIDFPFFDSKSQLFGFPTVWNYITYTASWLNFLLAILVIVLTCNEITFKTQRQNIIDGLSRREWILAKFYLFIVLGAVATIYTFLIGFIFGWIYSGLSDFMSGIEFIGIYFVQIMGYLTFAFLFAVLVKKSALAIILYMVILLVAMFFPLIFGSTVAQFLPTNVISDLTPFPFFSQILSAAEKHNTDPQIPHIISQTVRSAVALCYISVFVIGSYTILRRRDL